MSGSPHPPQALVMQALVMQALVNEWKPSRELIPRAPCSGRRRLGSAGEKLSRKSFLSLIEGLQRLHKVTAVMGRGRGVGRGAGGGGAAEIATPARAHDRTTDETIERASDREDVGELGMGRTEGQRWQTRNNGGSTFHSSADTGLRSLSSWVY